MVGERWKIGHIIEERKGKYPKDRVPGEGRQEIEVKIGHIWKKDKEKVKNVA